MTHELINFVHSIVDGYTLNREQIEVGILQPAGSRDFLVKIEATPGDKARIIGKKGKNFNALAVLVDLFGKRNKVRARLLPLELGDVPGAKDRYLKFAVDDKWPKETIRAMAAQLACDCLPIENANVAIEQLTKADCAVTIYVSLDANFRDFEKFQAAAEVVIRANAAALGQRSVVSVVNDERF